MSTITPSLPARGTAFAGRSLVASARAYFASDRRRTLETFLGLVWLLDGALQFQSFMYSKGFVATLTDMTDGQPGWLASSINWAAHIASHQIAVSNTVFALTQVAIGVGLLYRPTVKAALVLSLAWAFIVWWFGEAFGLMFTTLASPLTGAPGAVSLYALIGLIAWPGGRPGGLLGVRGARVAWGLLWGLMAWLWLGAPSSSANAISDAIKAAPSGLGWLSTVQGWAAGASAGHGLPIALVLAGLSLAIGLAVATNRRPRPFLFLGVALNLTYWVFGQGLGGLFEGNATDPNTGVLFVLLAYALATLVPLQPRPGGEPARVLPTPAEVAA